MGVIPATGARRVDVARDARTKGPLDNIVCRSANVFDGRLKALSKSYSQVKRTPKCVR
jgi:hypothetical protein